MSSSVKISLDTRRPKKDGTFPIILRVTHNRKTTSVATGYSVPAEYWDQGRAAIKKTYKGFGNITRVNNHILKQKAKAIDRLTKLDEENKLKYMSVPQVKEKLGPKSKTSSFFQFTEEIIQSLLEEKRIGNARSYRNVLREIKKFQKNVDFPFTELNYQFLTRLEHYYLAKGLSVNGLGVYMRTIRAIFNKAIKAGLIDRAAYPFETYSIKSKPTKKRAIRYEDIQKIEALNFEPSDPLFEARSMFLLSFYLMGVSFIDLAFLKVGNLVDGRVQYKRRKTGKFYDIKISANAQEILDHYLEDKEGQDYIFPIIKRTSLFDQFRDIQWALKRYNTRLKEIAQLAGIEENLTSYVSRHTFASIANNMEIPVTAISQMLGHTNLTTTQVYLASLRRDIIDEYGERVIGGK